MRPFAVALAALASQGCATTLSTLQTADVTDVGQVQVTGGYGIYAPVGPIASIVDQGIQQAKTIAEIQRTGEPYTLSEEDKQALITAAIGLAVMPPGANWEIAARTGVWRDKMDVGLRYSVSAIRLDAKYQFLHSLGPETQRAISRTSFDMSIGFGVSRYLFDNPALDVLEYVQLGDFSRWDLEVPLLASLDVGDAFKFYGGARYVYSSTTLDGRLVNYSQQATNVTGFDVTLPDFVPMHYVGGILGVAAGYRYAHLMLELNGGYTACNPVLFGKRRSLGGATFYPAIGLGLKFP